MLHEGGQVGLVEDDPIMGESLLQRLTLEGLDVVWLKTGRDALDYLKTDRPDLIICDIRLPDMTGEDLFTGALRQGADAPFLFITAYGEIGQAVRLVKAGASDYLTKPFDMDAFLGRVDGLLSRHGPADGNATLGVSDAMRNVETLIRRSADLFCPVLFTGETGVGKEVCATYMHRISQASDEPFIAVNCSAIPRDLLESEIFGHEKGAFTGATRQHRGYAERARRGILFLDEISELQLELQAKLLRLIEDRHFLRVGGETPIPFTAQIVCASNIDLETAVERARFRADLLFRINVVRIDIPPLRSRPADIPPLIEKFVEEFAATYDKPIRGVSSLAEVLALSHEWPGNARELRNRVERAVALADGEWLMPADLFPEMPHLEEGPRGAGLASLAKVRDAAERHQIERALDETEGQIAKAAALLGISRTTMWEKMRRLDILPDRPI
ncbi:MAG: sigma-54-dependent transcriptional regulator [Methyloligellaceae bacterium]